MYDILIDFINTKYILKVFPINLVLNSRKDEGNDQESIQSNIFFSFEIKN